MGSIRDRIAAASAPKGELVTVPEWDVTLEIRSITVKQRAALLEYANVDGQPDMVRFGPMLLVASLYDPDTSEPAFSADDVDMLSELPAGIVDRLATEAMRVSGLQADAVEAGKGGS